MKLDLDASLQTCPDVMVRIVGDEAVLLHLGSGTYFGLNELGVQIWQMLGDGVALRQVCDALAPQYAVARDEFERDVLALAAGLCDNGLVTPVAARQR